MAVAVRAVALSIAGSALVVEIHDAGGLDAAGIAFAVAAAVTFAIYLVGFERVGQAYDAFTTVAWAFGLASLFWLVASPPWTFPFGDLAGARNLALGLGVVVVGTLLPFLLIVTALRHLSAARVGVVATLEPVLAAVIAWAVHGGALAGIQIAGGLLVVGAVAWVQLHPPAPEAEAVPGGGARAPLKRRAPEPITGANLEAAHGGRTALPPKSRIIVLALVAAALLAPATPVADARHASTPKACADADLRPAPGNLARIRAAIVCLHNRIRAQRHLPPLTENRRLRRAARRHSRHMVADHFFEHTTPGGRTMVDRIVHSRYVRPDQGWALGENLAWGTGSLGTARAVVGAWMHSPGHRENILERSYRELGVGVVLGVPVSDAAGGTYTVDFGVRR